MTQNAPFTELWHVPPDVSSSSTAFDIDMKYLSNHLHKTVSRTIPNEPFGIVNSYNLSRVFRPHPVGIFRFPLPRSWPGPGGIPYVYRHLLISPYTYRHLTILHTPPCSSRPRISPSPHVFAPHVVSRTFMSP